jgi:hypothetical protein
LLSIVTSTSNPASAALRNSSPFSIPAHPIQGNGFHLMVQQIETQSPVEILVQKKAHLGCRECMLSRFFQESDHLLALYGGESLEELLDRITRLQVIEQTLHRHASTSENWLAAKNFRILRYNAAYARRSTAWFGSPQK